MIPSFKHKGMQKFFEDGTPKGIQAKHLNILANILDSLDAATTIEDMNLPRYGLHLLEPKHERRWAVKVSANWRITSIFRDGDAFEVDYLDNH